MMAGGPGIPSWRFGISGRFETATVAAKGNALALVCDEAGAGGTAGGMAGGKGGPCGFGATGARPTRVRARNGTGVGGGKGFGRVLLVADMTPPRGRIARPVDATSPARKTTAGSRDHLKWLREPGGTSTCRPVRRPWPCDVSRRARVHRPLEHGHLGDGRSLRRPLTTAHRKRARGNL
jgi:hypothetical protein